MVVGWQVYETTGDPLALGLIGLSEALPFIAIALYAAIMLTWSWIRLPETLHPEFRRSLDWRGTLGAIAETLREPQSRGYTLATTVSFSLRLLLGLSGLLGCFLLLLFRRGTLASPIIGLLLGLLCLLL